MNPTTDFAGWLAAASPDDHEEVYCLFKAVEDLSKWGLYDCTKREVTNGVQYFVTADHVDQPLLLASAVARTAFIRHLEKEYSVEGMGIEAWHFFKHAMEKDD